MSSESVIFKRCCFCVPLRYGLLTFGYLKLIASLIFAGYMVKLIMFLLHYHYVWSVIITMIVIIILLLDIGFCVVFIVGAHMKHIKLLRVYYVYSIVAVVIATIMYSISFGTELRILHQNVEATYFKRLLLNWLQNVGCAFVNIVLQVYVILLTKSEISKLRANYNFRFVNNAADAECTLQEDELKKNSE